jgi:hypothetical protein
MPPLFVYWLVLLLFESKMMCCTRAEGDMDLQAYMHAADYSIGASEPMWLTGAEFHAHDNAWSVSFDVPDVNYVLVFALCREPCPSVSFDAPIRLSFATFSTCFWRFL